MHILGSSIKEELCLQDIWTGQTDKETVMMHVDSYIPTQNCVCGRYNYESLKSLK